MERSLSTNNGSLCARRRIGATFALCVAFAGTIGVGMADPLAAPTPTAALQPAIGASPFPGEIARFGGLSVQLLVGICHRRALIGGSIDCSGEAFRRSHVRIDETPTSYMIAYFAFPPGGPFDHTLFRIFKPADPAQPSPAPAPSGQSYQPLSRVTADGTSVQILDEACAKIAAGGKLSCRDDWIKPDAVVLLDGERYYDVYFMPPGDHVDGPPGLHVTVDKPLADPTPEPAGSVA